MLLLATRAGKLAIIIIVFQWNRFFKLMHLAGCFISRAKLAKSSLANVQSFCSTDSNYTSNTYFVLFNMFNAGGSKSKFS